MSRREGKGDAGTKAQSGTKAGVKFASPLKPQRKLFVVLCVAFALWVLVLIVMYFATVYPHRHR